MFKTLKRALAPIASFAALGLVPAPAHAEGGDYLLPVVETVGESNATQEPARETNACVEARKVAWFMHEVERSDGDVSPVAPNIAECNREIYAAADE